MNLIPVTTKQHIIIIKTPSGEYEAWSDLKKSCLAHGWTYYTIVKRALPTVTADGCTIHRINI
jgi:hypothetical protein